MRRGGLRPARSALKAVRRSQEQTTRSSPPIRRTLSTVTAYQWDHWTAHCVKHRQAANVAWKELIYIGQLAGGQIDRVFELVSTVLAGPHVSNTMIRQMLGPFWCNNSSTTLRTLDDWPVIHGDPSDVPDPKQKSILTLSRNRAQTIAKLLSFCASLDGTVSLAEDGRASF
jgi:hypothetical protein